jgi:hypothetical protein
MNLTLRVKEEVPNLGDHIALMFASCEGDCMTCTHELTLKITLNAAGAIIK